MTENQVAQTFGALAAGFMEGFDEEPGEEPLACAMAVWSRRPDEGIGVRWHVARGQRSSALSKAETLRLLDDLRGAVSESGRSPSEGEVA